MAASDDVLARTYSCGCLNVTLNAPERATATTDAAWLSVHIDGHAAQLAAIQIVRWRF